MHLFGPLIGSLENIVSQGGYIVIFLTSILEGIPLIGSAIPGHTVIILGGFLAKTSVLSIVPVMLCGAIGAIFGDAIAYVLGRKYGYGFLDRMSAYLSIPGQHIEKAKRVVETHTGKAIIFGRFSPITRPLMPFIVGASGVHIRKFWLYDIIGGVAWAISSVLIGYIFGAGYGAASGYIGKFVGVGVVIAILLVWAYNFINKKWHVFVKYDVFTLVLMLVSLYATFEAIEDVVRLQAKMLELDVSISLWMVDHFSQGLVEFTKVFTNVFSPSVIAVVSIISIAVFAFKKKWHNSLLVFLSIVGVSFWPGFLKDIIMRVRPEDMLVTYTDFSFPSFHASIAAMAAILLIYIFLIKIERLMLRESMIVAVILLSFAVCLSRVYLNVHWFSDVVAGYSLGILWTTMMVLFVKYLGVLFKKR